MGKKIYDVQLCIKIPESVKTHEEIIYATINYWSKFAKRIARFTGAKITEAPNKTTYFCNIYVEGIKYLKYKTLIIEYYPVTRIASYCITNENI